MIFSLFKRNTKSPAPVYPLSWVTPHLAVGHAPMSPAELHSIREQSIQAIMNLCLEIECLVDLEREYGFEVYYLPIPDEEAPELDTLDQALEWLDEAIYLGKKVLVHCRHGIGRTGTVVYSYLLRKGLGPKGSRKVMNGLRSHPTEHAQKRLLRAYGKKEGVLTIGQPCLLPEWDTQLQPCLDQLQEILQEVDAAIPEGTPRCGLDHTRCCFGIVDLCLAEAVLLQKQMNSRLSSTQREECIRQALMDSAVLQTLSEELQDPQPAAVTKAFEQTGAACPLLRDTCLLAQARPVQCRLSDLPQAQDIPAVSRKLANLSAQIYTLYSGLEYPGELPQFHLFDVISGKFVQRFFHILAGACGPKKG